jgi:CheY-like chemotaxis protein
MSESKLAAVPYCYGTIVEVDNGVRFSIGMWHPILKNEVITQSFAYVMIVEPDDAIRESILRTVTARNCAVDVARDEDEAVAKAVQHRPQLIIVKQHEPLGIPAVKLLYSSIASRICRRAKLSRAVRLVTHSDAASQFKRETETLAIPAQFTVVKLVFKSQPWRKEWYSHSANDLTSRFLSDYIPVWLGQIKSPPLTKQNYNYFKPSVREEFIKQWMPYERTAIRRIIKEGLKG